MILLVRKVSQGVRNLRLYCGSSYGVNVTSKLAGYWRFYWPLTLTGFAMVLGLQFQNATLARYPDAVRELAVFALAQGTFGLFQAALNFMPQLSNVYARSPIGRQRSQRFSLAISTALAVPLLLLALGEPGRGLIGLAYGVDATVTARVTEYLLLLTPLLWVNGQRHYYVGLLVQARLTGWVTILNVCYLSAIVLILMVGYRAGWRVVWTLVGAQTGAALLHLTLAILIGRLRYVPPVEPEHAAVSYSELIRFFIPMTTTGIMFALSRPILYGFVGRTPAGLVSIAALRVGFDFSMIFQQAANQFRHFFVTYGLDDLAAKRRFMGLVGTGITLIMLVIAVSPLSDTVLGNLLGLRDPVKARAVEVILIMCLLPGIIVLRNYFHGILMVRRRTAGMAAGGILRVAGIYAIAQLLFSMEALDHVSAAFVLLAGFGIETAAVVVAARRTHSPMGSTRTRSTNGR